MNSANTLTVFASGLNRSFRPRVALLILYLGQAVHLGKELVLR